MNPQHSVSGLRWVLSTCWWSERKLAVWPGLGSQAGLVRYCQTALSPGNYTSQGSLRGASGPGQRARRKQAYAARQRSSLLSAWPLPLGLAHLCPTPTPSCSLCCLLKSHLVVKVWTPLYPFATSFPRSLLRWPSGSLPRLPQGVCLWGLLAAGAQKRSRMPVSALSYPRPGRPPPSPRPPHSWWHSLSWFPGL